MLLFHRLPSALRTMLLLGLGIAYISYLVWTPLSPISLTAARAQDFSKGFPPSPFFGRSMNRAHTFVLNILSTQDLVFFGYTYDFCFLVYMGERRLPEETLCHESD